MTKQVSMIERKSLLPAFIFLTAASLLTWWFYPFDTAICASSYCRMAPAIPYILLALWPTLVWKAVKFKYWAFIGDNKLYVLGSWGYQSFKIEQLIFFQIEGYDAKYLTIADTAGEHRYLLAAANASPDTIRYFLKSAGIAEKPYGVFSDSETGN